MTAFSKKIIIIVIGLVSIFPIYIFAQETIESEPGEGVECSKVTESGQIEYCLLEPIFASQHDKPVDLGDYLGGIYKTFFILAGTLAFLMLVWGGFQYMTSESGGSKGAAKSRMYNAILGLALALGSYLILATINEDLVKGNFEFKPIPAGEGISGVTSGSGDLGGPWPDDSVTRNMLLSAGIGINKSNCSFENEKNCTSVYNLPMSAIEGLIGLKKICDCSIVITGGTESAGHRTHGPGKSIVDLRSTTSLNQYLWDNEKDPADNHKESRNGAVFTFEDDNSNSNTTGKHWHVVW